MLIPEGQKTNLTGLRVLVTRPRQQAVQFIKILENAGMLAFELPCIDIVYREPRTLSPFEKVNLQQSDWMIFTSANAVAGAAKCRLLPPTESTIKTAAIGQATGKSLKENGIHNALTPTENLVSEQLIKLIYQQIKKGDKITIVRGDSGRDVLKNNLQSLGTEVRYLEVYQRLLPNLAPSHAETTFISALPCVITITSDLGLNNLLQLLPTAAHEQLFDCPLIVNSERCATLAKSSGFKNQIQVAQPPGDQGQLNALSRLQ